MCNFKALHPGISQIFSLVSLCVLETYRGTGDLRVIDNSIVLNITDHVFEVEYPFADFDYSFSPISGDVFGSDEYRPHARLYIAVSVLTFLFVLLVMPCYVLLEVRLDEKGRKYFYHSVRTVLHFFNYKCVESVFVVCRTSLLLLFLRCFGL